MIMIITMKIKNIELVKKLLFKYYKAKQLIKDYKKLLIKS